MPHRPSSLALGLVACAAVLAAGCADRSVALPVASPSPVVDAGEPSPVPSPTPAPPAPVDGTVRLTAIHLEAAGQLLHPRGSAPDQPPPVDEAAVHAFAGDIDRWLDARLTALQDGGIPALPGHLDPAMSPTAVAAVTTDLTTPDTAVSVATYDIEVAVDGDPRWGHVTVTVERVDGTTARADFVFVPGADGPVLIAAGPTGEVQP